MFLLIKAVWFDRLRGAQFYLCASLIFDFQFVFQ